MSLTATIISTSSDFLGYDCSGSENNVSYKKSQKMSSRLKQVVNINFTCPALQERIHVPCSLQNCKYYLSYEWSNNCLLAYIQQQSSDLLTMEEISYLYAIPVGDVSRSLEKSLTKLRREIIKAEAESNIDLVEQFKFIESKKLCCVCGSRIESRKERIDVRDLNLAYCSEDCAEEKNQYAIALEYRTGLPVEKVLEWVLRKFRSLSLAEKALGIPKWAIYELCLKFLSKDIREFFPDAKEITPKRRSSSKTNTIAAKVLNIDYSVVKDFTNKVYGVYGNPSISFGALNQKLYDIIGG